jgi:hypothetical protein
VSVEPADPLPYRGEFGAAIDFGRLAVAKEARERGDLLAALLSDPHLAELDRDLRFADAVLASQRGRFDGSAFLDRGQLAIGGYVRRAGPWLRTVFTRDEHVDLCLQHKLVSLIGSLDSAPRAAPPPAALKPSQRVKEVFGRAACCVPLTPVRGATLLHGDRASAGRCLYAFRLSTPADGPSASLGTARLDVGRSVFVDDVDLDPRTGAVLPAASERREGHVPTQILIKGVGPTPYANNRFSPRASGCLTLLQGERDWAHSEQLARGGVPVYLPLELALLPYCDWHPQMGWRPLVIYARLPLENLRVADLQLFSLSRRRAVIATLRAKLAACAGVPARRITGADLVRFVAARLGRIAGLCESGCTFDGRPFFHGVLHSQNISLLGELVDLGEGRFVGDSLELDAAYAASDYVNPGSTWSPAVQRGRREATLFRYAAHLFAGLAATVLESVEGRPRRELDALFWRSHGEGAAGLRADRVESVLGA